MSSWVFLLAENTDPRVALYLEKEELDAVFVWHTLRQGVEGEDASFPTSLANSYC